MARKMAASSVRTLFLLTGVCATLFAMGSVPLRDPDVMREMDWKWVETWGPVLLLAIAGPLIGYVRFHRKRYIVWGGVLGLMIGLLLAPIARTSTGKHAELAVACLIGIVGLMGFQLFIRRSRPQT